MLGLLLFPTQKTWCYSLLEPLHQGGFNEGNNICFYDCLIFTSQNLLSYGPVVDQENQRALLVQIHNYERTMSLTSCLI